MCRPTITDERPRFVLWRDSHFVVCSGCYRTGPEAATYAEAVRLARESGWLVQDGSACCPDCQVEQRR